MRRRIMVVVAMATAIIMGIGSPALALDCYIASRSDTGNANATHSARWITSTVEEFANSPEFPPGVDPDCFVQYWLSNDGPESFTVRSDKVIGAGSSNPNGANGKGLEYIEQAFGALLGAAIAACPA